MIMQEVIRFLGRGAEKNRVSTGDEGDAPTCRPICPRPCSAMGRCRVAREATGGSEQTVYPFRMGVHREVRADDSGGRTPFTGI